MWENKEKQEPGKGEELYPAPARRVTPRKQVGNDGILVVQCILCIVAILFVLVVRTMDSGAFASLRTEFGTMLTQGIDFSGEAEMVRLVNGVVNQVRQAAQGWVEQLEGQGNGKTTDTLLASMGSGGTWPARKGKVPSGASVEAYTLPETLVLPVQAGITSAYGFRKHPVTKKEDFHGGLDLGAAEGTPVLAALEGQVTQVGYSPERGNYIILRHRAGLQSLYQHLSCGFVRMGETVKVGQSIGGVGSTGLVTGAHLHFELILDSLRVDPLPQFPQLG